MNKFTLFLKKSLFFGALLCVLPNCAKYRPASLPLPTGQTQNIEGVEVITRKLTKYEFGTCFDTSEAADKFDAVQIYVKNNRTRPIVLSANNITLPLEGSKVVAETIHRNTVGRAAGYTFGGLFFWPLLIPAAVDGAKSSKANYKINQDINAKGLTQNTSVVIDPNRYTNRALFVRKEQMKSNFTITLVEEDTEKRIVVDCLAE